MKATRVDYLLRTKRGLTSPHKAIARQELLKYVLDTAPTDLPKMRALTMPGAWWHFEVPLLRTFKSAEPMHINWRDRRQTKLTIKAVEAERATFALAVHRMPRRETDAIVLGYDAHLDSQWAHNSYDITHYNCNVHRFATWVSQSFDLVWLDFCSPYSDTIAKTVEALAHRMAPGWAVFALTVMKGRECYDVAYRMRNLNREAVITQECLDRLGPGWNVLQCFEYRDGTPMLQFIFTKQANHGKRKVRPSTTKNPAAVALGRLGGGKGGAARAAALSPERRREIAIKAARARWDR